MKPHEIEAIVGMVSNLGQDALYAVMLLIGADILSDLIGATVTIALIYAAYKLISNMDWK